MDVGACLSMLAEARRVCSAFHTLIYLFEADSLSQPEPHIFSVMQEPVSPPHYNMSYRHVQKSAGISTLTFMFA